MDLNNVYGIILHFWCAERKKNFKTIFKKMSKTVRIWHVDCGGMALAMVVTTMTAMKTTASHAISILSTLNLHLLFFFFFFLPSLASTDVHFFCRSLCRYRSQLPSWEFTYRVCTMLNLNSKVNEICWHEKCFLQVFYTMAMCVCVCEPHVQRHIRYVYKLPGLKKFWPEFTFAKYNISFVVVAVLLIFILAIFFVC